MIIQKSDAAFSNVTANKYDLLVLVQYVSSRCGKGMEDESEMNVSCCLAKMNVEFNNLEITIENREHVSWPEQ